MNMAKIMEVFALSLEMSEYITNMARLMDGEEAILKNKIQVVESINKLDVLKEKTEELQGVKVAFSADLIKNLSETLNKLYGLHEKVIADYEKNDLEELVKTSKLYNELSDETGSLIKETTGIKLSK